MSTETIEARPVASLDASAAPWGRMAWGTVGFLLALGLLLPWVLVELGRGRFLLHLIISFFLWSVVTQSWNLVLGVSGIYSFARVAFFAVGGWTTGVLAVHFGWNPWFSMLLAPLAAAVAAVVVGLPMLRLRGIYVVLLTLAFHELLRNYTINGPEIISGGGYGLKTVPKLSFGPLGAGGREMVFFFYLALIVFALSTYLIWRVFKSPVGLAFQALRDSETYAVSRGIDQFRMRLALFAFSAFLTGLAAGVYTHYLGSISPSVFSFSVIIDLLAMIVIGGLGTFGGPIFGTALLIALNEWLREFGDFRILILGLSLAAIAVFAPQGVLPLLKRTWNRYLG